MVTFKRLMPWLAAYEFTWLVSSVASGLALLYWGKAHPLESVIFIKSHSPLRAALSIWLSNTSSYLIAAVLTLIHPLIGVLAVLFMSIVSSDWLTSWLAGYCSTAHFIYGIIESEAYILLLLIPVKTYLKQGRSTDLVSRWLITVKDLKLALTASALTFLALAFIEVAEVLTYG